MNDFYFEKLKNVKTPDSWIETAINIPEKKQKQMPILFKPSVIGSAAAVLVVVITLFVLLFHTGSSAPLTQKPQLPVSQTTAVTMTTLPNGTSEADETVAAEQTDPSGETIPSNAGPVAQTTTGGSASANSPSTTPTEQGTALPPEKPQERTEPIGPTERPTQTAPTGPAVKPSAPIEPTTDAVQPTTVTSQEHTEPSDTFYKGMILLKILNTNPFYEDGWLYVHITDGGGKEFSKKFSSAERSSVQKVSAGHKIASIYPYQAGVFFEDGVYTVEVYDNRGNSQFFTATLNDRKIITLTLE